MKRTKTSPTPSNQRYELRKMVKAEVQKAMAHSQAKLDVLQEKIELLANDTHVEVALGKLEVQIERLERRAEAAMDHVMQLVANGSLDAPRLKNPQLPAAATAQLNRSDSAEDSDRPASSHIGKHSTAGKAHGKLLQAMEDTKNSMRMMKVEYEALKVVLDDLEKGTSMTAVTEGCLIHETPAVPVDVPEVPVQVEEPLEQTIAEVKTTEEPINEEPTSQKHIAPEAFTCPPLPAMPFPAVLDIKAVSYNIPPQLSLQLALIRQPPGLSLLWNVEEEDPSGPPMESYSVYVAMEAAKGSGVFPNWRALGVFKAIPLPMCVLITGWRPGCKAGVAVVGKDVFQRYGPHSEVMLAELPEQTSAPP